MEMDLDLEEIILYLNANEPTGKYCKNIENLKNALTELKQIKEAKPSEALECVDEIEADLIGLPKHVTEYDDGFDNYLEDIWYNINIIKQTLTTKSKKEQAFDIIKEKNVDVKRFRNCLSLVKDFRYEDYAKSSVIWKQYSDKKLTQDEFDLLKEMI